MKKILRLLSAAMLVAVMVLQPTSVVPFTSSSAPTVAADTTAGSCLIANGAPSNLNCNSNNVAISNPSVNVINGCNGTSGDTTTFDLTARVVVANSHRYDIGFWVSTNGQSPVNGSSCIAANMAGQGGSCNGLDEGTHNNVSIGRFTVRCIDTDNNGFLNVPITVTWGNDNNNSCNTPQETIPSTSSRCNTQNNFSLPVAVPAISCTKTSAANSCGMTSTTTGTIVNNVCNAPTPIVPANPTRYGQSCTSTGNACGASATGTLSCTNVCSAVTPIPVDTNENQVYDCLEADVTLSKTVDIISTYIGNILTYSISYRNLSAFLASGVVISDTLPVGTTFVSSSVTPTSNVSGVISWSIGNLLGYGTGMFNLVVDTDNAQSGAVVTNTATITSNNDFNSTNNSSTSSGTTMLAVPLAPFVDVSINKEANTSSTPVGSQITYTLTYINNGNRTANNVVVTDTLPVGSQFVSSTPSPTSNVDGVLTWDVSNLEAASNGSITVTIDTDEMGAGDITNNASTEVLCISESIQNNFEGEATPPADETPSEEATPPTDDITPPADETPSEDVTPPTDDATPPTEDVVPNTQEAPALCDSNSENNADSASTTLYIPPTVDVSIVKTADTASTAVGNAVTYTLSYANNGNSTAQGVVITDVLPAGVVLISTSVSPSSSEAGTLVWELESLSAGQTGSITVVVGTITLLGTAGLLNGTASITNNASISSLCYREDTVSIVGDFPMAPLVMRPPVVCDNNEGNNAGSATTALFQQGGGGGAGAGGGGRLLGELLDTGGPLTQLLDTGAPQDEKVTRAEVADMIVKHYKDVLKQTIVRKDSCDPKNYSDYKSMNTATRENIYDVCSLGLMGWSNDRKIQIKNFRPSDYMTKGEFSAVLSRMLFNRDGEQGKFRYFAHMSLLRHSNIINGLYRPNDYETKNEVAKLLLKKIK